VHTVSSGLSPSVTNSVHAVVGVDDGEAVVGVDVGVGVVGTL